MFNKLIVDGKMTDNVDMKEKLLEEVGHVSYKALNYAKTLLKPGALVKEVAIAAEKYLNDQGYAPAFPINLSINNEAAHYTPSFDDERIFTETDIVKVDFGAYKDGISGDCAITIDLSGKNGKLIDAANYALDAALSKLRAGITSSEIGREINTVLLKYGVKPIRNLGGHGLDIDNLHSGFFIPNYDDGSVDVLEEGMVISIEPFATNGKGMVADSDRCEIYSYVETVQPRLNSSRALIKNIEEHFSSTPFAVRWLANGIDSHFNIYSGINELVKLGAIEAHPILLEIGNGMVSQSEVTVLVEANGCKVLTK
jgi:methionyl aminopeptidase